ncbi:MAG: DUF4445 domain-containing protein [Clostridia bacterium]|nr:DUF4445 domain-containing protein [Clostridia bacterium]
MAYRVRITPPDRIIESREGESLLDSLVRAGISLSAPCGGKGRCGKCKARLISGEVEGVTPDESGFILTCRATALSDLTLELCEQVGGGLVDFCADAPSGMAEGYGIAVDIGTTTLAGCLVDLSSGTILSEASSVNPQSALGADVLSRIEAACHGKLDILARLVRSGIRGIVDRLTRMLPSGAAVSEVAVAGNTTMLHLLLGVDPSGIGVAPFVPAFTEERVVEGREIGLDAPTVRLLPSASAYIGSDITAGAALLGIDGSESALFIDIGTNGEILLSHEGRIYGASTAAGPALEGACIECGTSGVLGAISRVRLSDGRLDITTVGGAEPIGICGSGLLDLVALLLDEGIIEPDGCFNDGASSPLLSRLRSDRFYLTEDIYLSLADIRQIQLAKSAIRAGVECLLNEVGIDTDGLSVLYVAGGLGYYMDSRSAARVGLFPSELLDRVKTVGNSSLGGACASLFGDEARERIRRVAEKIQIVELSTSPTFADRFINNMFF